MPPPQKIKMYYDPRGQVVHTVNPDGTEQRVIFGVPNGAPTAQGKVSFTPTPWESYTYDANDLSNGNYAFDTPKSALVDALGRTIKTTEHRATALAEDVVMQYEYDIRGNLLKVTDALDRTAFEYTYDLKPKMGEEDSGANVLRTWHIDKGIQTTLYDASFKPIEGKDAKGSWVLNSYDNLQRPIQVWGEDRSGEGIRLAQKMVYGSHEDYNNINKIIHQYDAAGKSTTFRYDFKGNLLESIREVLKTEKILEVFDGPPTDWNITCFKADWSWMDESEYLNTRQFLTDMSYDALNRIVTLEYPADTTNTRNVLTPHYNKAGALERVELGFTEYVNRIAYNAKGQRIMIAFGNGIMTRYAYDSQNFRLKRIKSQGYEIDVLDYKYLSGTTKQDYAYFYDEVGNILNILDKTPEAGVGGSSELDRQFTYDPLYRLLSATGRENVPSESEPWQDYYRSEDRSTTSAYTRSYAYDKMGNIQELHHSGDSSFTRTYVYSSGTNKLAEFSYGGGSTNYYSDENGNIIQETETRHFEWDYADRMRVFRNQSGSSQPTVYTQYFYDAGGNRVMKFTRKQDGPWEWTVYINGVFEWTQNSDDEKQSISHIMDDKSRIASERTGHAMGDSTPDIKYNLEDHLGSSMTLLDESGSWVSWEEYYPFGETSLGSYAKKRYRFTGKERDEESGLYYYGARYYLPWLCRFASVDPLREKYPMYSSYLYAGNKPIIAIDIDGLEEYLVLQFKDKDIKTNKYKEEVKATIIFKLPDSMKKEPNSKDVVYANFDAKFLSDFIVEKSSQNNQANEKIINSQYFGNYIDTQIKHSNLLNKKNSNWENEFRNDEKQIIDQGLKNFYKNQSSPAIDENKNMIKGGIIAILPAIPQNVTFESGSSKLTNVGKAELDILYKNMSLMPETTYSLEGHTDDVGNDASNLKLSTQRAEAAKEYLVGKGIDPSRLSTTGFGETKPVAVNQTDQGRALNRRIDMTRTK